MSDRTNWNARIRLLSKLLVMVLISMGFMGFIVDVLVIIPNPKPFTVGGIDAWIGFFGSCIGGIIGGVVAFSVASWQISVQRKNDSLDRDIASLPALTGLQWEIKKIASAFESIKNMKQTPIPGLNKAMTWNEIYILRPLDDRLWSNVGLITDDVLQSSLLEIRNIYENACTALASDINKLTREFESVQGKLNNVSGKKTRTARDNEELSVLQSAFMDAALAKQTAELERKIFWSGFESENYVEKVKLAEKELSVSIDSIRESKTNSKRTNDLLSLFRWN